MSKMFVKPLWLVPPTGEAIRTTLKEEQEFRRFAARPGLCVTADSAREARHIAFLFNLDRSQVQQVIHPSTGVPVQMAQPRW